MAGTRLTIWTYRPEIADPGDIGGYSIHARDGDIGKVDKHDIETERSHLLVTTGPWIFGKTVMLPAGLVERIDHEQQTVHLACTKDDIKNAPEYHEDGDGAGHRSDLDGYYVGRGF